MQTKIIIGARSCCFGFSRQRDDFDDTAAPMVYTQVLQASSRDDIMGKCIQSA